MKFIYEKIITKVQALAVQFFWFLTKNRQSPKNFKVEKKWFSMPKIKISDPLTYINDFGAQILRKNAFFSEKKIPTLVIFFWTDNFIGNVYGDAFVFIFNKTPIKFGECFACGFAAVNKHPFMKLALELFFVALLKGRGGQKTVFRNFFGFLLIF